MGRVTKFGQIVEGMTSVLDVPLTVKVRTGIYSDKNIAHTLMPKLRDWGVALATVSTGDSSVDFAFFYPHDCLTYIFICHK